MQSDPPKLARRSRHSSHRRPGSDAVSAGRSRIAALNGVHSLSAPSPHAADTAGDRAAASVVLVAASLDLLGGQGVQAQGLADHLRADGLSARLLPVNPAFPCGVRWLRRLPYARTLVNQALYLSSLPGLRRADVVHVFSAAYFSFLLGPAPAMLAARLLGKRLILNYHSGEAEDHLTRWGPLVHPWLRLADEIVVPSIYLQGIFTRFGYPVKVISNLIDVSRFRYRERVPLGPRFLSIRNLESHYGVDVILHAFARIQLRYPRATLLIGGDGSQRRPLERLARELGLRGVTFIGSFAPTEAPDIYDDADVLLNASAVDNQPVSLLEAFASGLPVVSTATGDIGNMLQGGRAGAIVSAADPEAIAMAAMRLLNDPGRARLLARTARTSLDGFTWSSVRNSWMSLYGQRQV